MSDQNALKRAVAAKALDYVKDGMKLGLGSGSTAEIFVEMLAPRIRGGEKLLCVPRSERPPPLTGSVGSPSLGLPTPRRLARQGAGPGVVVDGISVGMPPRVVIAAEAECEGTGR